MSRGGSVLDLGPPCDRCLICDAFDHFPDEQAGVRDRLRYSAAMWNLAGTLHQHSICPAFTDDDVERDLALLRAEIARLVAAHPSLRDALQFLETKLGDPGFADLGPPYARLSIAAMARMCEVARGLLEIRRFSAYAPREPDAGERERDDVNLDDVNLDDVEFEDVERDGLFLFEERDDAESVDP